MQKKREQARGRKKAGRERADGALCRIAAVLKKQRCPAVPVRVNQGYNIYRQGEPVSRIRQRCSGWEVLWMSHRGRWESIGDMGGVICDTVEEAVEYIMKDPMGIFWR